MSKLKKRALKIALLLVAALCLLCGCDTSEYILNEDTFFLVMTNMQYYPGQYVGKTIEADLFMYTVTDIYGNEYQCAVRKCSSGYGCNCGADTVIGFVLEYDGELPEPKNQSEDTNDKAWVHVRGTINSAEFPDITIHSYDSDGNVIEGANETLKMLVLYAEEVTEIEDYSGLSYYVTE
ncbi:MAG: hypothetical protein LUD19_03265 [Clostridia bacterium]|nr:hypothetical protein [Clostridia bacterium]